MPPRPADNGRVLYAAPQRNVFRTILLVIVGVVVAPAFITAVILMMSDPSAWPLLLIAVLLLVVTLPLALLLTRSTFVVSTDGLTVVNVLRSFHVWWPEVALIEIERAYLRRGATAIRCKDGRRIVARVTAAAFATRRGESTGDHGRDLLAPAKPTRAAQWAHTQFLRGEFTHGRARVG